MGGRKAPHVSFRYPDLEMNFKQMALETLGLRRIKCYLNKCMLPLMQHGFRRTVLYILASVLLSLDPVKALFATTWPGVRAKALGLPCGLETGYSPVCFNSLLCFGWGFLYVGSPDPALGISPQLASVGMNRSREAEAGL